MSYLARDGFPNPYSLGVRAETPTARASDPDCVFCGIVEGRLPGRIIYQDARSLAFLDVNPASRGHTLVVPRTHVRSIVEADPQVAGDVFAAASQVSRLLTERLRPDGITIFQANETAGWQDVFHLHVHVVPRWEGDKLVSPWESEAGKTEDLDAVAGQLNGAELLRP